MKNIFTIVLCLAALCAKAQLPEKNLQLLVGSQVRVKPIKESDKSFYKGYEFFYTDPDLFKVYMDNGNRKTKDEALSGRIFKVTEVGTLKGTYDEKTRFILKDDKGETLYYHYAPTHANFLEPVNFEVPADYFCLYIKDDAATSLKSYTAMVDNFFLVSKSIDTKNKNKVIYSLTLQMGKDGAHTGKGATLTLDDNVTLQKPDAIIDIDNSGRTPHYSATFLLTEKEAVMLTTHRIAQYTIANHSAAMFEKNAWLLKGIMNCLIAKQ